MYKPCRDQSNPSCTSCSSSPRIHTNHPTRKKKNGRNMMFQLLTSFFCSIHVTGTQHTQSINSEFRRTLKCKAFFQFSFKADWPLLLIRSSPLDLERGHPLYADHYLSQFFGFGMINLANTNLIAIPGKTHEIQLPRDRILHWRDRVLCESKRNNTAIA